MLIRKKTLGEWGAHSPCHRRESRFWKLKWPARITQVVRGRARHRRCKVHLEPKLVSASQCCHSKVAYKRCQGDVFISLVLCGKSQWGAGEVREHWPMHVWGPVFHPHHHKRKQQQKTHWRPTFTQYTYPFIFKWFLLEKSKQGETYNPPLPLFYQVPLVGQPGWGMIYWGQN
jgi:hypothetical protein